MIEERKHDPLDFALWKKRKEEGEIAWESPWGLGRPGWHIECSAMSKRYLGETIDIHAGGQDLQFPHHENEIAQSEAHNGCTFANYWMHNGYITIDDEKMSKSAGNFFTVRDTFPPHTRTTNAAFSSVSICCFRPAENRTPGLCAAKPSENFPASRIFPCFWPSWTSGPGTHRPLWKPCSKPPVPGQKTRLSCTVWVCSMTAWDIGIWPSR